MASKPSAPAEPAGQLLELAKSLADESVWENAEVHQIMQERAAMLREIASQVQTLTEQNDTLEWELAGERASGVTMSTQLAEAHAERERLAARVTTLEAHLWKVVVTTDRCTLYGPSDQAREAIENARRFLTEAAQHAVPPQEAT